MRAMATSLSPIGGEGQGEGAGDEGSGMFGFK